MSAYLWIVLSWLSLPVVGVLAGVCVWRKTYRDLPLFFSYAAAAFLIGILRLVVFKFGSRNAYFYVYWYSDFFSVLAALLAIYEVFLRRIFPSFFKTRFYRVLFPAALSVIALLAFLAAIGTNDRKTAFALTSRSLDFLRTAVIGFFAGLVLLMGRRFSGPEFWIASGFGVQAAIALAAASIKARLPQFTDPAVWAELITYDVVSVAWLIAFWRPVPFKRAPSSDDYHPGVLDEARTWESMLKTWLAPSKSKR